MDEDAFERELEQLLLRFSEPMSGWVLQMALNLDEATSYPVVVSLHRATDFRRSVAIAVLTAKSPDEIQSSFSAPDQRQAMQHLFHDDIRSVLRKVFGFLPGLTTALGKMNGEAFEEAAHYDLLLTLLTPGSMKDQRQRALALRHARTVNSGLVTALAQLDGEFIHPNLAHWFAGQSFSNTANAVLRYVQSLSSTPVTTGDLIEASKGARSMNLQKWADKLIKRKADRLPPGPLDDHPGFKPLKDATDFARIGREFRNCLDDHVMKAATGRVAFYIATHAPGLIVELQRHTYAGHDLWALKGIHARGNGCISTRDQYDVEALLRQRGISPLNIGYAVGMTDKLVEVLLPDVGYNGDY